MKTIRNTAFALFFLLSSLAGFTATSAAVDGNTFTNDVYNITVSWTDDWNVIRDLRSGVILSRGGDVRLEIGIWDSHTDDATLTAALPGETLAEDTSTTDVAGATYQKEDGTYRQIEVQNVNDVKLQIVLTTTADNADTAIGFVQNEITVNDSGVFTGQPIGNTTAAEDLTGEATAESTSIRTSRNETPEATAESTSTRTSRAETPEATTQPVTDEGLVSFTGPVFGYTIQYDGNLWSQDTVFQDENLDGIRLSADNAALTVWAWNGYGADPQACLQGEADFYASEVDSITNWQVATDANGQDLEYLGEDLSWGVYTLKYDDTALVDYISCQPIPGHDAVLITLLSSYPDTYNDALDTALDVTDTVQFAESNTIQLSTNDDTSRKEISTAVDGTVYTSPNYGFTMDVPLEWTVVSEDDTPGDESVVLNNGTSTVIVWAVDQSFQDLDACVDYAAAQSGQDLTLDKTSTGADFRGEYGDQAFANFVYESTDGTRMTYYIGCQEIPDQNAYIIVIQDVPYDQFTAQRRFRLEIENSIVFP